MFGVVWKEDGGSFVTRLGARTLAPLPGPRVSLWVHGGPWALSPDGSEVAFGGTRAIRIVDLARMRLVGDVANSAEWVEAVAWPDPNRILLAKGMNWETGVELVVVDPTERRVVFRRSLAGSLQDYERTREGLAFVLGPRAGIGPARLVLFSADGGIRVARLERVPAGFESEQLARGAAVDHFRTPGVAVDEEANRAFVAFAGDEVAEVDLATMGVVYHQVHPASSILGRLRSWLDPIAEAKGASDGSLRRALWLGSGRLVVSGWDDQAFFDRDGRQQQTSSPAGVHLVDTRSWKMTTLHAEAGSAVRADDILLAFGSRWDSEGGGFQGVGLSGFDLRGRKLFHLFDQDPIADVQVVGSHAFAAVDDSSRVELVDLRAGRSVRTLDTGPDGWPTLLRAAG